MTCSLNPRELKGWQGNPDKLEEYLPIGVGNRAADLILWWSRLHKPMCREILEVFDEMEFFALPYEPSEDCFVIKLCEVPQFPNRGELALLPDDPPENIQDHICLIKCYGAGVRLEGASRVEVGHLLALLASMGIRINEDFRPLLEADRVIPIILNVEEPPPLVQCFAVMCVYIVDGRPKVVVSLYFASSNPFFTTKKAIDFFLKTSILFAQSQPPLQCSVQ
jgi:hypothetical protein